MGVRGKRVHLIEQMSNCVVSFQKGTSGRLLSLLLSLTNNLLLLFLDLLTLLSLYRLCTFFFCYKISKLFCFPFLSRCRCQGAYGSSYRERRGHDCPGQNPHPRNHPEKLLPRASPTTTRSGLSCNFFFSALSFWALTGVLQGPWTSPFMLPLEQRRNDSTFRFAVPGAEVHTVSQTVANLIRCLLKKHLTFQDWYL